MTFKEYQAITKRFVDSTLKMGHRKGLQYANSTDRLDNFKRIGKQLGISPEEVAMVYATKHWDSINWAIKTGNYQDIEGRIADVINYLLLLRALIIDS